MLLLIGLKSLNELESGKGSITYKKNPIRFHALGPFNSFYFLAASILFF